MTQQNIEICKQKFEIASAQEKTLKNTGEKRNYVSKRAIQLDLFKSFSKKNLLPVYSSYYLWS